MASAASAAARSMTGNGGDLAYDSSLFASEIIALIAATSVGESRSPANPTTSVRSATRSDSGQGFTVATRVPLSRMTHRSMWTLSASTTTMPPPQPSPGSAAVCRERPPVTRTPLMVTGPKVARVAGVPVIRSTRWLPLAVMVGSLLPAVKPVSAGFALGWARI